MGYASTKESICDTFPQFPLSVTELYSWVPCAPIPHRTTYRIPDRTLSTSRDWSSGIVARTPLVTQHLDLFFCGGYPSRAITSRHAHPHEQISRVPRLNTGHRPPAGLWPTTSGAREDSTRERWRARRYYAGMCFSFFNTIHSLTPIVSYIPRVFTH